MEQAGRKNVVRGCIKSTKGPWLVRRATKNGDVLTNYRFPSARERLNNKQRERTRRSVTRKIFSGLRAHGNYDLPKHADSNDLLKAICEEAGWHVEEDGTIFRKHPMVRKMTKLIEDDSCKVIVFENEEVGSEDEEVCKCSQDTHHKEPNTTLAL